MQISYSSNIYNFNKEQNPANITSKPLNFKGNVSIKVTENAKSDFVGIVDLLKRKYYSNYIPDNQKVLDIVSQNFENFLNTLNGNKLEDSVRSLKSFKGDVNIKVESIRDFKYKERPKAELESLIAQIPENAEDYNGIFLTIESKKKINNQAKTEVIPVFGTYNSKKEGFKLIDNLSSIWQMISNAIPRDRF